MDYLAHTSRYSEGGHMWGESMGLGMGFGLFLWLVFWVIVVSAIAWLLLRWGQQGDESKRASPEDIAKERYAKGEIDQKEYQKIIKDLQE